MPPVRRGIAGRIKDADDVPKLARELRERALDEGLKEAKEKAWPPEREQ